MLTESLNNKFSPEQIQLIEDCQKTIQELQDRQLRAYNEVVQLLPPLKANEMSKLWDFIFNDEAYTISLDEKGLKVQSIFQTHE